MITSLPQSVVILTGSGISAESGLATFRSGGGLWNKTDVNEVCSRNSMENNPALVYEFYNQLWDGYQRAVPNAAHKALASLQRWAAGRIRLTLITQNIDGLLETAGAPHVLHMHGILSESRCTQSGKIFNFDGRYSLQKRCACCTPGQLLRPNVVFFDEMPFHMDEIREELRHCDVFCSIGTSGAVLPAGSFVTDAAKYGCKHLIEQNLQPPVNVSDFDLSLRGRASKWVPILCSAIRDFAKGNEQAFDGLADRYRDPEACQSEDCLVDAED